MNFNNKLPDIKYWTEEPRSPNAPVGKCQKCGLELYSVMGYVCPNIGCPTGLGSRVSM